MSLGCFATVDLQKSKVDLGLQPTSNHRGKLHGMDIHAGGKGIGVCAQNIGEKNPIYTETNT